MNGWLDKGVRRHAGSGGGEVQREYFVYPSCAAGWAWAGARADCVVNGMSRVSDWLGIQSSSNITPCRSLFFILRRPI